MSEIPSGWCSVSLGELCSRIVDGSHNPPKAAASGHAMLSARNIQARRILFDDFRWISEDDFKVEDARTQIAPGDVLLTIVGTIGRTAVVAADAPKFALQRSVAVLKAQRAAEPRYLAYALESPAVQQYFEENAKGTAQKGIYLGALGIMEVPLAPRSEQKRIADKLDALLARVDRCRDRLDRVPGILKRFRQSVLAAATSGELTREWREERGLLSGWRHTSVAAVATQVFDGPFGSNLKSNDYANEGIRVVRLENIAPLRFIEEKRTYIPFHKYDGLTKHTLLSGDILFSSFVDEEVRVCLLPEQLNGQAINKADCFCIRSNPQICRPGFLALRLACRSTFEALDEAVHGATRPRINLGQLREISFDLPSLDEQDEIIRRSAALLDVVDSLDLRVSTALRHVDRTSLTALAKAFRGELVPQDPNDEPASRLLARLRSPPDSEGNTGKPKRGGTRVSRTKAKGGTNMLTRKDVTPCHLSTILKERGSLTPEALWSASQLEIDDFYDQLKDEEARGLLRENRGDSPTAQRTLEAAA